MRETSRRNLRNLSIPAKKEPKYRNDIEFIIKHLEIDNYSEIIRMCVSDKAEWIKGNKVLVSSSNPHNKSENLSYLKKLWIDLLKNIKKSSMQQKERLYRNFIRDLFLVIEKLEGGEEINE